MSSASGPSTSEARGTLGGFLSLEQGKELGLERDFR